LLEKFFKNTDSAITAFIGNANTKEPETALDLFRRETEYFLHNSMLFNLSLFEIEPDFMNVPALNRINEKRKFFSKTSEEKYEFLKQLQGRLQGFHLELRNRLNGEQSGQLNQLISSVRSAMHSVKSTKDIGSNIINLKRSSKEIKHDFFLHQKQETENLYRQLQELIANKNEADFEKLRSIFDRIQNNYSAALDDFYQRAKEAPLEDTDITTSINFNRELFTSNKAMLIAIKDFLLNEKQAVDFNEIPVYKT
jgi:phosphate:Na+ symporter